MIKWAPAQCDFHNGPAFSVAYGVRTFRLVDGRRTCASCMRNPGIRWLMLRANWAWFSESVNISWTPPNWILMKHEQGEL